MELPLVLSGLSHGGELVASLVIGLLFGLVLERSGFGRADVLVSIFYGRSFRVMRVMFSAIVVSMLGLYLLDLAKVMPLSNLGLLPTFVGPAAVGGMLLGVGFIIGGYCPGTSLVATVSGHVDGMLFLLGLFFGSLGFEAAYESVAKWHTTGGMGRVLVQDLLGLSSGVVVFGVVVIAVASLVLVRRIEDKIVAGLRKEAV